MDINEANMNLIKIGNAVIIKNGLCYIVSPRTTSSIKLLSKYKWFYTVDEAYYYAVDLPSNWEMDINGEKLTRIVDEI